MKAFFHLIRLNSSRENIKFVEEGRKRERGNDNRAFPHKAKSSQNSLFVTCSSLIVTIVTVSSIVLVVVIAAAAAAAVNIPRPLFWQLVDTNMS